MFDNLAANSIALRVLAALPGDTEVGTSGRTAAQMREEANARREEMQAFIKQGEGAETFLRSASDAQVAEYTDRFVLHGEFAAMTWLTAQAQAAK